MRRNKKEREQEGKKKHTHNWITNNKSSSVQQRKWEEKKNQQKLTGLVFLHKTMRVNKWEDCSNRSVLFEILKKQKEKSESIAQR